MHTLPKCDHDSFLAYWQTLAKTGEGVPRRSLIDPRAFSAHLPNYYLLERRHQDFISVRLLGTALDAFLPSMSQGMNFLEVYPEEVRPFYANLLRDICEVRCGARVFRTVALLNGGQAKMESIAMPFASDEGDVRFIAGLADAPNPGQLLGVAETTQRMASTVEKLEYIDLGFGVPACAPSHPALSDMPIAPETARTG